MVVCVGGVHRNIGPLHGADIAVAVMGVGEEECLRRVICRNRQSYRVRRHTIRSSGCRIPDDMCGMSFPEEPRF